MSDTLEKIWHMAHSQNILQSKPLKSKCAKNDKNDYQPVFKDSELLSTIGLNTNMKNTTMLHQHKRRNDLDMIPGPNR